MDDIIRRILAGCIEDEQPSKSHLQTFKSARAFAGELLGRRAAGGEAGMLAVSDKELEDMLTEAFLAGVDLRGEQEEQLGGDRHG
ncbi:hypothetical protein [Methylococcus sp. EFPC2]|uniref:hypothetical protein n=1 Tax=Methylococcus sp. EFPC2 TaxID=2812648 RepID=UPI0019670370|nr:hypothetical protein [Methylococcus sp. EFPC2]QSA98724.1 hypothetical protein JWZ97_08055 [Methylococcus sp. EFPC2]